MHAPWQLMPPQSARHLAMSKLWSEEPWHIQATPEFSSRPCEQHCVAILHAKASHVHAMEGDVSTTPERIRHVANECKLGHHELAPCH